MAEEVQSPGPDRSGKPTGYPYTAGSQAGDLAAVADAVNEHFGAGQLCCWHMAPSALRWRQQAGRRPGPC